jgi:lipopolysaccharide transport system ATP-binding protein
MTHPIITVENLGKYYKLGRSPEKYQSLRDTLARQVRHMRRGLTRRRRRVSPAMDDGFWALNDINFAIQQGDRVGIIGRNGAGKSTLLKILSRITEPTTGEIRIRGRVASLLEVGTGFHPELTGRENIYLNGAVLGMSKAEICRKFDEIVDFAEVDRFLDTPVKRYSSGMYVRLAFSVAAHLEPEILVIDEVLAVGDAKFQQKCLGKMQSVSSEGRTVLFVSHNMSAVANLCNRGIVLDRGQLRANTDSLEALNLYNSQIDQSVFTVERDQETPHIRQIELDQDALRAGHLKVQVRFHSPWPLDPPIIGIVVSNLYGTPLFGSNPKLHSVGFNPQKLSDGEAVMWLRDLPLHSGTYKLSVWLGDQHQNYDQRQDALTFEFMSPRFIPNMPSVEVIGPMHVPAEWSLVSHGA